MSSPAWHSCRAAIHPKAVLKLNLLPDHFNELPFRCCRRLKNSGTWKFNSTLKESEIRYIFITGGDSSNKGCFGRKTNLFRESGDFAGNRETWEIVREIWDIFGTLRKIWYYMLSNNIYTVTCTQCMRCILRILTLENGWTSHDMKRPISNVSN